MSKEGKLKVSLKKSPDMKRTAHGHEKSAERQKEQIRIAHLAQRVQDAKREKIGKNALEIKVPSTVLLCTSVGKREKF